MSVQICGNCGNGFSGEDDDDLCEECALDEVFECEEETGHSETREIDGEKFCKRCGILV